MNSNVGLLAARLSFLEQLTALSAENCDAPKVPYFYRVDQQAKKVQFGKGSCKQWSCPSCAARNAKKWVARVIDGCNKLDDVWYFGTLTAHKWWRKEKSMRNLQSNWPKVRKRFARLAKIQAKQLFYVRVWEAHKDGSFHMHFISNIEYTQNELKDIASECGLGYMAHIEEAKNPGQVAGYIAKYMVKSMPLATNYPQGSRRIEVSRNWIAWHEKATDWQVVPDIRVARSKARFYKSQGYTIFDLALRKQTGEETT